MKPYYLSPIVFLATLSINEAMAAVTTLEQPRTSTLVATLNGGASWYHEGKTQSVNLQPDVINTYDAQTKSEAVVSGAFFLGLQRPLSSSLFGQLGVALAADSPAKLRGDIWQMADPNFNNLTYQYHVRHTHVAIKSTLLSERFSKTILPYLSGSLGVGFNQAYNYSSTAKIFEALPGPAFQSNTETAFTYTVGIGIQKIISTRWQAGIGYEFADWGKNSLSKAPGQISGIGLQLAHFYTHQLQLTLSYLIT